MDEAKDCDIVENCLILKHEKYAYGEFQGRKDFKFVYSDSLKVISRRMFCKCETVESIILPALSKIDEDDADIFGAENLYNYI